MSSRDYGSVAAGLGAVVAFTALTYGMGQACRSPLFTLRVVEVAELPEGAPVDAPELTRLAGLAVDKVNLFDVDLAAVEARLLSHPWIREAKLQKRLPQTLSVEVTLREPKALIQLEGGAMAYVDSDGRVFGKVNLTQQPDLPLLTGLQAESHRRLAEALKVMEKWSARPLPPLASLSYHPDRGYRALVSYELTSGGKTQGRARAMVDLGQDIDTELDAQLERLRAVFHYLKGNAIPVRQIWADAGKKIVVKIARGS